MKPTHILFCLLLFISNALFAQSYGNEWIQYNQKYYSFKIVTTGIHKLDYSTLSNAGVPLTSFTSANIQLFGREKEIPLFIEDGGDQSLDSGDYILFYAERNDAWLDATLYESSDAIGNPKYSLYNDTIQYFLRGILARQICVFQKKFLQITPILLLVISFYSKNHNIFQTITMKVKKLRMHQVLFTLLGKVGG